MAITRDLTWIAGVNLVLIHASVSPEMNYGGKVDPMGTSFDSVTYQLVLRVFT